MKIPRDVSGAHLADVLCRRWQYMKGTKSVVTSFWKPPGLLIKAHPWF